MGGSRKYPYPHHRGHWKFRGQGVGSGRGSLKGQNFKGKNQPKLEFPKGWGGGSNKKKPSVGSVWIFSGTTQ